jgi:tetratricopeptide (TPR) repeat protein
MRKFTLTFLAIATLVLASSSFAQVRGRGRLQGSVVDKVTGKPIADATVTVSGQSTQPIVVKTSSNGRWAAIGMTTGGWNVDISAPGYETLRGSVNVSETQQSPPIESKLAPSAAKEETPAAVQTTPLIPPDAVAAIKEGQELLGNKGANADEAKANAKKAVADFEKALPQVPTDKPEVKQVRTQLMEVMAQAYYKAGDLPHAVAMLEQMNVVDPWTTPDANVTQRNILLVNLYLENGELDKGKALMEKLPEGSVTDPTVFTNIGILFMNKKNPTDSITYFSKAIALDPKSADGYYYRGLAEAQIKKTADARADFEQVIALAPTSTEASDAKQMLAALPTTTPAKKK